MSDRGVVGAISGSPASSLCRCCPVKRFGLVSRSTIMGGDPCGDSARRAEREEPAAGPRGVRSAVPKATGGPGDLARGRGLGPTEFGLGRLRCTGDRRDDAGEGDAARGWRT